MKSYPIVFYAVDSKIIRLIQKSTSNIFIQISNRAYRFFFEILENISFRIQH
jgi:hypothetical protein